MKEFINKMKCFLKGHEIDEYQTERKNNGNLVKFCWRCHKEWFTNEKRKKV